MTGEPLDAREVTFGKVTFRIGKLLPMEAKQIFLRHCLPLLSGALEAPASAGKNDSWKMILAGLTKLPPDHYEALSSALYKVIDYKLQGESQFQALTSDMENAFKDLDAVHLVLLDGRAFTVNFQPSWDALVSEFPALKQILVLLKPKTSTPSLDQ